LKALSLENCTNITDYGIMHITALSNLKYLNLTACNISDNSLRYIIVLQNLSDLSFGYSEKISDEGLKYLAELKKIKIIFIDKCNRISNDGIDHLLMLMVLTNQMPQLYIKNCDNVTLDIKKKYSFINLYPM
jgi:F-box/leucine-rich repeat protein 14